MSLFFLYVTFTECSCLIDVIHFNYSLFRKNIILTNVVEERLIDSSNYSATTTKKLLARRELSQAMIPGDRLVRVEIDQTAFETRIGILASPRTS